MAEVSEGREEDINIFGGCLREEAVEHYYLLAEVSEEREEDINTFGRRSPRRGRRTVGAPTLSTLLLKEILSTIRSFS